MTEKQAETLAHEAAVKVTSLINNGATRQEIDAAQNEAAATWAAYAKFWS